MSRTHTTDIWQFKIARWAVYVTIFLVPLYATTAHWYPFTTPKTLLILSGTITATIAFLWGLVKNPRETVGITAVHYVLGVFILVMAIASALGVNPHQSFFGTFFSSTSIVLLITLATLACLIAEFARRDVLFMRNIFRAVFWSGVITAFVTYFPHLNSSWQLIAISGGSGFVGNSSFTGGFLLFAIGFGVYCVLTAENWKQKIWYILGLGAILLCPMFINANLWHGSIVPSETHSPLVFLGQAQGAILGLAAAVAAATALALAVSKKRNIQIIGGIIGAVLVVGIIVGYRGLFNSDSVIHQKFVEAKTGTRLIFWDIAQKATKEQPVLGWGFENYQTVYQDHFDPAVYASGNAYEQWVTNPHNVLFDISVSGGYLGLAVYLVLFGAVVWVYVREVRRGGVKALVIIPALLLGYLVQNFFIFDTPTTWLMYFVVIGLALGFLPARKEIAVNSDLKRALAGTKIATLTACFIVFVILPGHESKQWVKARDLPISPERIALQEKVQRISPMGSVDDDIVYAQKTFTTLVEIRADITPEEKDLYLQEIDSLVALLDVDARRYPNNFYVRYLAGSLIHLAYITDPTRGLPALDTARDFFDEARMISPANPKVYYNLAQNALFRKDTATALKLTQQGMTLGAVGEGEALLKRIQK